MLLFLIMLQSRFLINLRFKHRRGILNRIIPHRSLDLIFALKPGLVVLSVLLDPIKPGKELLLLFCVGGLFEILVVQGFFLVEFIEFRPVILLSYNFLVGIICEHLQLLFCVFLLHYVVNHLNPITLR